MISRKIECFIFLFFLILQSAIAQVSTTKSPDWVDNIAFEENIIPMENISGGQVYLLVDRQYHIEKAEEYTHYSTKIVSDVGLQNGSTIEINYDPAYEQVLLISLDVIRKAEIKSQLDVDQFQIIQKEASADRFIFDGSKTALFHLKDVRVGDIIDYKYIIKGRNPVFGGKFFASRYLNYQDPVGRNFLKVIVPRARNLKLKTYNSKIEPLIERGKHTVYRWNHKNMEGVVYDDFLPAWYDPLPHIQLSEYKDWFEVNQWAVSLFKTQSADLGQVRALAADIKQKNKEENKQIEAALNFVQDEIRYLGFESGLNSHKPHPPYKVLERRFGDCKDKSLLLALLLDALGVEAYPALVNTVERETLASRLPSPQGFDHCIVKAIIGGKTFWYDPTISGQGGTYDNTYFPEYKYALVLKEGTSGLEEIATNSISQIEEKETYTISAYDQPALLHINTLYKGREADEQRQYFLNNKVAEIQKRYLTYYAETHPKIKVSTALTFSDDTVLNTFTVYEDYIIEDYWKVPDPKNPHIIQSEVYPKSIGDNITDPGLLARTSPVYLNFPKDMEQQIEFYMPEYWSVESVANKIEGPGIQYSSFSNSFDKKITLNYAFKISKDHVPQENLKAYLENIGNIKNDLGFTLTYNKNSVDVADGSNTNGLMIVIALLALIVSSIVAFFIYTKYDPYSPFGRFSYNSIGGWLMLVAIGISISPILIAHSIFTQDYFNLMVWENITSPASAGYNPTLAALYAVELVFNIVLFAYSCLLVVLFFKQRSSLPRLIIIFYVVNLLFLVGETAVLKVAGLNNAENMELLVKGIFKSIVAIVIWVPYFMLSQRVKETFVYTYKDTSSVLPDQLPTQERNPDSDLLERATF